MKTFEQRKRRELRNRFIEYKVKRLWDKIKPFIIGILILLTVALALELVDRKLEREIESISIVENVYAEEIEKIEEKKEKLVYAEISAYTSSVDETDDTPFITASGERTRDGVVACPSKYDFGQIVEINGKEYECLDRMNARYRDKEVFDIWVKTKSEAFQWGRRNLTVIIKT